MKQYDDIKFLEYVIEQHFFDYDDETIKQLLITIYELKQEINEFKKQQNI